MKDILQKTNEFKIFCLFVIENIHINQIISMISFYTLMRLKSSILI